jgi:hypothetical protein
VPTLDMASAPEAYVLDGIGFEKSANKDLI